MSRAAAHLGGARARRRWAWAALGLALIGPAWAGTQADPGTALACTAHAEPYPPGTSLVESDRQLRLAQPRAEPAALTLACRSWRQVLRDHPDDTVLVLAWRANVAASLLWLGQADAALPLLEAVHADYQALGPAQAAQAGAVAGMLSFILHQRGQSEAALQWSQRAVDALAAGNAGVTASDRLRVRLNHASMLSNVRRFDQARLQFDTVLAEALAQPEALAAEAAVAYNGLAVMARRQSRFGDALATTEREITWREAHVPQEPVALINAMQNRGVLLTQLARYDEAEAALRAAVQRAEQAQAAGSVDLLGHGSALRESLSALLLARGQLLPARQQAAEAVRLLANRPEARTPRGARPLRRLAEAQLALGELADGLATYRQALALLTQGGTSADADTVQAVRLGLARTLLELGDPAGAEQLLLQASADPRPLLPAEQARLHALQAALAGQRGDTAAALVSLGAADAVLAASLPAAHPQRQVLQAERCELSAALCAHGAGDPFAPLDDPEAQTLVQLSLARRARGDGRFLDAEGAARRALAAASVSGQPRLLWQAHALLADLRADAAQLPQAILFGKLALAQLEQQRERLLPMGTVADARYLADKAPLYRRVVQWLMQAERLPEALAVMRLLKRHEQAQFNERGATPAETGPGLTVAEQAVAQRLEASLVADPPLAAELQRLTEREASQRITPAEQDRLRLLRQGVVDQGQARLARLNTALDRLSLAPPTPTAPPARLTAQASPQGHRPAGPALPTVPPGQLHAYLLAGPQQLSLLLAGPRGSQVVQVPVGAVALTQEVAGLRDQVEQRGDVLPDAQRLFKLIGQPLVTHARRHQARRIVLWLDGPLRYLPIGLLHDGQRHLVEQFELVVNAADSLTAARTGARPAPGPQRSHRAATALLQAWGVTQALAGMPALPAVADELCGIVDGPMDGLSAAEGAACLPGPRGKGPWPGTGHLNAQFTEAALVQAAHQAPPGHVLHLGTHFVLRPGNVSQSWLLVGDGSRLPLQRMRSLGLGSPSLVTLSACDTGLQSARPGDGREVDGLAAALLDNGARQVLASLWRLDDRATATFMQHFYGQLAALQGDAPRALQRTQAFAARAGWPARHWAAFTLTTAVSR